MDKFPRSSRSTWQGRVRDRWTERKSEFTLAGNGCGPGRDGYMAVSAGRTLPQGPCCSPLICPAPSMALLHSHDAA
eukprot:scaffold442_cov268-Pinguiococcus_pyrenoidosus.AAC.110